MTKKEAEDYRYGYQHIGDVKTLYKHNSSSNSKEVSIRKVPNCGGWIDLDTEKLYSNESVEIVKINNNPFSSKAFKIIKLNN